MQPEDLSRLSPHDATEATLKLCGGILVKITREYNASARLKREESDILADFCIYLLERNAAPLYLWQGRCQLSTWTALIFRRWLRDQLRSRNLLSEVENVSEFLPARGDDICNEIHKNDIIAKLQDCIQALPELHREIIREKIYHEPKITDLGKKYKMGQKIYPFLHNIMEQIKNCLQRKNVQFGDI